MFLLWPRRHIDSLLARIVPHSQERWIPFFRFAAFLRREASVLSSSSPLSLVGASAATCAVFSLWSCPKCSGAENPARRSHQGPICHLTGLTCVDACITDALKWLLATLRGDGQSQSVHSLSDEELLSFVCVAVG